MKNKKRLILFLSLSFGISWATALSIYLTGGLADSPVLLADTGITLALVLMATLYMWSPALANGLTRLVTREGRQELFLRPNFKTSWKFLILSWFSPGILILAGTALFFLCFPQSFDAQLAGLQAQLSRAGYPQSAGQLWALAGIQTLAAMVISPAINAVSAFGEEFGWRAYLLPKLRILGVRKALLISSAIWGVWHWPVIAMGHNYGLDYPGFPWLGFLATLWFTLSTGVIFGWLSLRGCSVWPAVFAHGALNGIASIGLLFAKPPIYMLLGPSPAGIIGSLPFTLVSFLILLKSEK